MARQSGGKARTKLVPAPTRSLRGGTSTKGNGSLQERLAALERERDGLRASLKRAEIRIQQLEAIHAQVRDRVTWALDSLQSVLAGKK